MSDLPNTTILNVGADPAGRYGITRVLQHAGFRVVEAGTGAEALQLAEQGADLILLDVNLPDLDGFEVCRRLRADPRLATLAVLHVSASQVESGDRAEGLERGADGYLVEPIEPRELVATVTSLIRLRRAEQAARGVALEWRATFDAIRDAVWLVDAEGRILRCNRALAELVGQPAEQLTGQSCVDVLPEPLGSTCGEALCRTWQPGERDTREVQAPGRWFRSTTDPVFDENGVLTGFVHILADVTELREASQALLHAEERFRALVDNAQDFAIFMMDPQGFITNWNSGAERIIGFTAEEAIGQSGTLIFTPEDRAAGVPQQEMRAAAEHGRAQDERWHMRKDGTRFFASGVLMRLQDGQHRGFAKILRDTTERRRLEQELQARAEALQRADLAKNEFLAMLGHELRNPMAAMSNSLELLRIRAAGDFALERLQAVLTRQMRAMTRLVEDLLDMSRITSGKIALRPEEVDLGTVVQNAVQTARPFIEARGHVLHVSLPPHPITLTADPIRLEQVLANLLNNAAKYTDQRGTIWLSAAVEPRVDGKAGSEVVLRVRDTGRGISALMLPRIFDLFTQVESTLDRSEGGLGLGLTLVRRLVELHGGTISAHSDGPGTGAEFVIRLPLPPGPAT